MTESLTTVSRVTLPCGSFDALHAVRFSQPFPPHFHETFAIGAVESGRIALRTARGSWVAGPGTVLAFAPGEVHGATPLSDEGLTYRMVYPGDDVMREIGIDPRRLARHAAFSRPVIDDPELGAGASVADVAYACGFSDQAHLTRVFKR